jgi:hypothetical protein
MDIKSTEAEKAATTAVMILANAGTLEAGTVTIMETTGKGAGTFGVLTGQTKTTRSGMIRYSMVTTHDGSVRWVSWFKVV